MIYCSNWDNLSVKKRSSATSYAGIMDIKWDCIKQVRCLPTFQCLRCMDILLVKRVVAGTWQNMHVILVEVNEVLKTEVNDSTETIWSSVYFWFSVTIELPCPPPGDLPHPGIQPRPPASPTLQAYSSLVPSGKPKTKGTDFQFP